MKGLRRSQFCFKISISQVIKIVRKVRPDWPREDIILHRLPSVDEAAAVTNFGAYTDNKAEAVMVRVYSEETRLAHL